MAEPLQYTITVAVPREHAFRVFTADLDRWWPPGHRTVPGGALVFEPHVGGQVFERGPDGARSPLGDVLLWAPPEAVAFSWRLGAPPGRFTRVDVRFSAEGHARTRVEVVHQVGDSGLGALWPDRVRRFAENWRQVLASYVTVAEEGR